MKLKDKVVLVTGASKGIGRATALTFAKEGCHVIINFKSDLKSAQEVFKECNGYSRNCNLMQADISNQKSVSGIFEQINKHFGSLDILINNAGIFNPNDNYTNIEAFENIFRNNFLGAVIVTKYALPLMKKGKIVNISSIYARLGSPNAIAYSAFKASLENYTKSLAKELAPDILVNAVSPGRVTTQMWGSPDEDKQKILGRAHLIRRMIQPKEVADAVVFLAKNDAICGEVLTIDGGLSLVTLS